MGGGGQVSLAQRRHKQVRLASFMTVPPDSYSQHLLNEDLRSDLCVHLPSIFHCGEYLYRLAS